MQGDYPTIFVLDFVTKGPTVTIDVFLQITCTRLFSTTCIFKRLVNDPTRDRAKAGTRTGVKRVVKNTRTQYVRPDGSPPLEDTEHGTHQ